MIAKKETASPSSAWNLLGQGFVSIPPEVSGLLPLFQHVPTSYLQTEVLHYAKKGAQTICCSFAAKGNPEGITKGTRGKVQDRARTSRVLTGR